ncbi:MAG: hypothetical protein DHS20C16_26590 [Phycisphaerae bacterium]|nr:MAG: hypothetical protein DHS20C16_26590 [Phycisphaerae bacterium]
MPMLFLGIALPAASADPSPDDVTTNAYATAFDALWQDMDRNYSYFALKPDVDWNALRTTYLPKCAAAKSTDQFVATLRECLSKLEDMHISIDGPGGRVGTHSIPWRRNWNSMVVRQDLTQVVECGDFAIVGKTRTDGFGYVGILNQSQANPVNVGCTVEAIQRLADVPAFVVDLRPGCSGGNELLARPIASAFNDKERIYAAQRYRVKLEGHALGPVRTRSLSAGDKPFTKPVACLIGHRCMSSGEALVLMFDCQPHVTTIGETTRGSSGNPKSFKLPGVDVSVSYSRWVALTPDQEPFEGKGVAPDIPIEVASDVYRKKDPTWNRALEFLRERIK